MIQIILRPTAVLEGGVFLWRPLIGLHIVVLKLLIGLHVGAVINNIILSVFVHLLIILLDLLNLLSSLQLLLRHHV